MTPASHAPAAPDRLPLILASTSRYRAELLARLRLPFEQVAPAVDEAERAGESPEARALRLATEKARAVMALRPGRWVIGSDQVASSGSSLLHKPGSLAGNIEQLAGLSGREARFITAVAVGCDDRLFSASDVTTVRLRRLSREQIERYVAREPAQDCAGGFKIEGLGIALFEEVRCQDPTALIGLPLIALRRLLDQAGAAPL